VEKKAVALCVFSDDVDDTVKESEVQKLHCAGSGSGEGAGGGGASRRLFFRPRPQPPSITLLEKRRRKKERKALDFPVSVECLR